MTQTFEIRHRRRYLHPGWTLTLLATRGPPLVTWRWALRDEGDDHDGRTGQYSGDQESPAACFLNFERSLRPHIVTPSFLIQ